MKIVPLILMTALAITGCDNADNATTSTNESSNTPIESSSIDNNTVSQPNTLQQLTDDFVGCYSTKKDTPQAEIMITKEGSEYFVALKKENGWEKEEKPLALGDDKDEILQNFFKEDIQYLDKALYAPKGAFALFKLKSNVDVADVKVKDPDSDYVLFFFLGATAAFQTDCS